MVFENKKIRTKRNEQEEDWLFSLVDVVGGYCKSYRLSQKMRKRDVELGAYLGTNCPQVEMIGQNGFLAGNTKAVLRLIR